MLFIYLDTSLSVPFPGSSAGPEFSRLCPVFPRLCPEFPVFSRPMARVIACACFCCFRDSRDSVLFLPDAAFPEAFENGLRQSVESGDEEPVIVNATVETLIFEQPYRTQAGIVIPLYMGTCQVGDRLCSMVYHDHLNADGRIERIYVPIETGVDGNSIMRAGNPGIITFQSVQPVQRKK